MVLSSSLKSSYNEKVMRWRQAKSQAKPPTRKTTCRLPRAQQGAGFDSDTVAQLKEQMRRFEAEVAKNKQRFDELTAEVNDSLELERDHVLQEFSSISGIPVNKLTQDERAKLQHLDVNLSARVFGQEEAVNKLSNQVRVARAGLQSPNQATGGVYVPGALGSG